MLITEDKYFIFDKPRNENFVYKTKVTIKFKNGKSKIYEIVAMKNNELISIDGDKIKIDVNNDEITFDKVTI